MYQIRDWLYIGKYSQTRNLLTLNQYGITAMLQLADYVPQENIESLFLNVDDGEPLPTGMIESGLQFLREQKAQNKTILVACGAGISRSSTFALAFLMELENLSLLEAYREVYKNHPQAEPHPELIKSLYGYHGETVEMIEAFSRLRTVRQEVDAENT
ncbi:MAG: hypothetical protein Phog2KO_22860 [Phototrophicaceae bacterium]